MESRPQAELAALLSQSLGDAAAAEHVSSAASALGLADRDLTREEALSVLEEIAKSQGLVGITARFAKTQVHLRWTE